MTKEGNGMTDQYFALESLREIVRVKTGVDVDTAALAANPANISELGIDSLGWLGVITEVENRYGIALGSIAETVTGLPELTVVVNNVLGDGAVGPGHTDNRVVINAPLALVWDMTNDVESWPDLFSEYGEAEILERQGDTVRFRLSTVPDGTGTSYSWVSERTPDRENLTVKAYRVETGIFEFMHIAWSYREVVGGVEMRWVQDFAMKPGGPADDAQATDYINRNSVVQMARIKGLVEAAAARAPEVRVA